MKDLAAQDPRFWERLERLRGTFLSREKEASSGGLAAYWQSLEDLKAYDVSFARRIAQKWSFALAQITELPKLTWVDWGCGTGVASEQLLKHFSGSVESVELFDHSPLSKKFAHEKLANMSERFQFNAEKIAEVESPNFDGKGVLMSHVLNEISSSQMTVLHGELKKAEALIWVESGSKPTSRKLSEVRDQMIKIAKRENNPWEVLFPCPACEKCGMLKDENSSHWCHFFAASDPAWHQDAGWAEFATKLKVDLRTVPLSALVMVREKVADSVSLSGLGDDARIIGKPRAYNGYVKVLSCSERLGVADVQLDKKTDKALFKTLSKFSPKDESLTRLQWQLNADGTKIEKAKIV